MTEDADIFQLAVEALIAHRDDEARAALLKLSRSDLFPPPLVQSSLPAEYAPKVNRPNVTPRHLAKILNRDGWRCHYCGRKLVVAGVIEIVGTLCPSEFPFPPGHHMPASRTHPAAARMYPEVDHIKAGSVFGEWADEDNLVAACLPCNERKSNRLGWVRATLEPTNWRGLSEYYRGLSARLSEVRQYHKNWLRALDG